MTKKQPDYMIPLHRMRVEEIASLVEPARDRLNENLTMQRMLRREEDLLRRVIRACEPVSR